jgi:hypothetical protein
VLVVVNLLTAKEIQDGNMAEIHLQKVRSLRQQIIIETSNLFADWNLVQKLLDELMISHRRYKDCALRENIDLYN